jgi:hypothetical protein
MEEKVTITLDRQLAWLCASDITLAIVALEKTELATAGVIRTLDELKETLHKALTEKKD